MADFSIDARQLVRLNKSLKAVGHSYKKGARRLLKEIGLRVLGIARTYCPESPQKKDYARMNKSGRTSRSSAGITSGSLKDSITSKLGRNEVSVNVPANSRGGKYAERIHDKKGSAWRERGPRTKQKGTNADEKFIFRAYAESEDRLDELVDKVVADITRGIGI